MFKSIFFNSFIDFTTNKTDIYDNKFDLALEMTNANATKGFAVKGIADALGIDKENIMCFGDGENDCSMLEFAEYSFAMANGTDLVKSTAKYVTDTNDNAGVAKAVEKYVFNKSGE